MAGEGFINLGRSLGDAAKAMAAIEIEESKQQAQLEDTQHRNQMYRDYLEELDNLRATHGKKLTSSSLKRKAYRNTIDKWKGTGVDISNFQAKVASGAGMNQFSTSVDDAMEAVDDMGLNVSESEFQDPERRQELITLVNNYNYTEELMKRETLTEKQARVVYENRKQQYLFGLSSQLDVVNNTINKLSAGEINAKKAQNTINNKFDTMIDKYNKLQNRLSEKNPNVPKTFGEDILKTKRYLQKMQNQYNANILEMAKAKAEASKAETEEEVAKADAHLELVQNRTKLTQALIKQEMFKEEEVTKAYAIMSWFEAVGLQLPPDKAEQIYTSIAEAANQIEMESLKYQIKQKQKNSQDYNVLADFVPTQNFKPDAVNKVVESGAYIINGLNKKIRVLNSDSASKKEKADAVRQISIELGALESDGLLTQFREYISKAARKYPKDEGVQVMNDALNNMFKSIGFVKKIKEEVESNPRYDSIEDIFNFKNKKGDRENNETGGANFTEEEKSPEDFESQEAYIEYLNNRDRTKQ